MNISKASGKVSGIAHQLHGAIGMTHEHQLHHVSRRLWAWREDYGNESYWARILAKSYLEDNDLPLWNFITNEKRGNLMSDLLFNVENGIATITLNRPESINAFSGEMLEFGLRRLKRFVIQTKSVYLLFKEMVVVLFRWR